MKTIYALNNGADRNISSHKFYSTKDLAIKALDEIKKDRKIRTGVTVIVDSEDTFQFIIGWQGHQVSFSIIQIEVLDNI